MNKLVLLLITFATSFSIAQEWDWVRQVNGNQNDSGVSIDVDEEGNVFVTGRSKWSTIFEDESAPIGPLLYGYQDVFVAKYSNDGELIWANVAGTIYDGYDLGYCVKADDLGGCYITGVCNDSSYFGTDTVYSSGGQDIFVSHLNATGDFVWTNTYGGAENDKGHGIELLPDGNLLFCGEFRGVVDFDGTILGNAGRTNGFYGRLSPVGDILEMHSINSTASSIAMQIEIYEDEYYLTGGFSGSAIIDGRLFSTGHGSTWPDAVLIKFEDDFSVDWVELGGGFYNDLGLDLSINDSLIFWSGTYSSTAEFDTITSTFNSDATGTSAINNARDIFVTSYNKEGNIQWFEGLGSVGYDEGYGVDVGESGDIYLSCFFRDTLDFGDTILVASGTSTNLAVIKYTGNGEFIWGKETGNLNDTQASEIKVDQNENIFVTGEYNSLCKFDDISHSSTQRDAFIGKIKQNIYLDYVLKDSGVCLGDTLEIEILSLTSPITFDYEATDGYESWIDSNFIYYVISSGSIMILEGWVYGDNEHFVDSVEVNLDFEALVSPVFYLADDTAGCDSIEIVIDDSFSDYLWNGTENDNSYIASITGWQYVIVENESGCKTSDSINVEIFNTTPTSLPDDETVCIQDRSFFILAESGFVSYVWSTGETETQFIEVSISGVYSVEVEDDNGCIASDTIELKFINCLGLSDSERELKSIVYNDGRLINIGCLELQSIEIFNLAGERVLAKTKAIAPGGIIFFNNFPSGIYFVLATSNQGTLALKFSHL